MTIEQALDTYLRADWTLVSSLSTTSALTTSSVISQAAHSIDRESGSFVADGWVTGHTGWIADSGTNNHALFTVTNVAALSLTVSEILSVQSKAQCGSCVLTRYSAMRLHWLQAPEGSTLPYVVYTMVSDTDMQEYFPSPNAGQGRAQFDVVAATKAGKSIEERLRTLLRHKRGTVGGLTVNAIWPMGRRESFNADTQRYVYSADYEVHCEY